MQNVHDIMQNIGQYTGTTAYHRFSPLAKAVLTDGSKYVAEELHAYWLFDTISSHLDYGGFSNKDTMYFSTLKVSDGQGNLTITDGEKTVAIQSIEFTDFPLHEIKVWSSYEQRTGSWVHMLPSEY
jgi:hypothetical protein